MNENEMKRLFAGYRDSLGTCERSVRLSKPHAVFRPGWMVAAGGVTLLGIGLALWPGDAAARATQRVETALRGVRSMEAVYQVVENGHRRVGMRTLYAGGKWSFRTQEGAPLDATTLVAGGEMTTHYKRLDHAVREPLDERYLLGVVGAKTPLEFAKEIVGLREVGGGLQIAPHADVDGKRTYALAHLRTDGGKVEIVVDAATDLPVTSEYVGTSHGAPYRGQTVYRYDGAVPQNAFSLPADVPIINLKDAQKDLARRWDKPWSQVGKTHVWDSAVTSDGAVWIVSSLKGERGRLPMQIDGFVRLQDLVPSAGLRKEDRFRLRGEDVVITGFVPIDPLRVRAISVRFGERKTNAVESSEWLREAGATNGPPVVLNPRQLSRNLPDVLTALDLDKVGFQIPILVGRARAEALAGEGRTIEAARAYEALTKAYEGWVAYAGHSVLDRAAELYAEAGQETDAQRCREASVELKASRKR